MSEQKEQEDVKKEISRRGFLKAGSAAMGTMVLGSVVAGCSHNVTGIDKGGDTGTTPNTTAPLTAETAAKQWAFEIPPAAIADSNITRTVNAEIIVIGAGTSGLVCANTAAEGGAKVIVIAKSTKPVGYGGSNHAYNSRIMKKLGFNYDINKAVRAEMASASFQPDQRKWSLFYKNSGEAMNWLMDKMEAAGYTTVIERLSFDDPSGVLTAHIGAHSWIGSDVQLGGDSQPQVAGVLAATALKSGVEINYNTVAEQLVRNSSGRVTAVIAKASDGTYTKYVGSKAIVLATGDITADPEMVAKYCPKVVGMQGLSPNTGDGQKMGLWVGAAWQKVQHAAPMCVGAPGVSPDPYGACPGLMVNKNAERYSNEDTVISFAAYDIMSQPEQKAFGIWTAKLAGISTTWYPFGSYYGSPGMSQADVITGWDNPASGIVKADTLNDLATKLGLPASALKATVDRYNTLCKNRIDEDFHKRAELLVPIEAGPFYGSMFSPMMFAVTGGLRTNTKMQILDKNDKVIPGLYGVGSLVGDMYNNCYTFLVTGMNLGANCVTFGYLTGKALAAGTA